MLRHRRPPLADRAGRWRAALVALGRSPCSASGRAARRQCRGRAQRLMYLHVPAAWLAYLAFGVTALGSASTCAAARVARLGPRGRRSAGARRDLHRAHPGARLAVGPARVGRLVGVGRPPRHHRGPLLPLPRLPRAPAAPGGARRRAKRCAIAALVAFVDVPIVHFSVDWWRTLHQEGTVFNEELDAQIHGTMAFTLFWRARLHPRLRVPPRPALPRLEALEEARAGDERHRRSRSPKRGADVRREPGWVRRDRRRLRHLTGWVLRRGRARRWRTSARSCRADGPVPPGESRT